MTRKFAPATLLAAALIFGFSAALAEEAVEVKAITDMLEGSGPVGLRLKANMAVDNAVITLRSSKGSEKFETGEIKSGEEKFIEIPQKVGKVRYQGKLSVSFSNGDEGEMPLSFELNVLNGLQIKILEETFDLEGRKFAVRATRPIKRIQYSVLADTGAEIDKGEKIYSGANEQETLTWGGKEGLTVIRIDVTVYDDKDVFSKMTLSPWQVNVEHEEVNFASGKDEIQAAERPKLDKVFKSIEEMVKKYGKLIHLNLYVVGYTDTVGKPDSNLDLSMRRARSIAKYFKQKGFKYSIYYQGFGEEVLEVKTPDETDEVKNRRALYILGGDYKPRGTQIPRQDWKLLE